VQLFATATDLAGNRSRTESLVPVAIFNEGEDLQCPDPVFTVTPTTAPQGTEFVFDPTYTSDQINEDVEIRVRWDFDGIVENGWTVDWDQDARASDVIRRVFDLQGVYTIRMEAHNSYLPDCIIEAPQRQIRVTPPGGEPDPPDPIENYMDVSVGIYPISKPDSTFVLDGARLGVDLAELPAHFADIRREFKISKYEVSNRWYLAYVDSQLAELEPPGPAIQFVAQAIWSRDTLGTEPPPPPVLYCQLAESRIFYSLDEERFVIEAGFEDHPVTGVTWDGANAYALTYGMRLPTEAEWEVAARGTNAELDYPFPGGIDLRADEGRVRVNYLDARRTGDPFVNGTTPVGFYNGQIYEGFQTVDTRSEFGCFDMAGNVAEWVNDWFGAYRSGTDIDPQGPPLGVFKVVRGGSHTGTRVDCRATARRGYAPGEYGTAVGFRCAFNPLEQPGK
jgi:formylglycine-generating enzyme required for sulfatase activity